MIFGTTPFTLVHVAISLMGIASGLVVLWGLLTNKRLDGWTMLFLASTIATSVTGFFFPVQRLLPSHVVGLISLVLLALAVVARYGFHLAGVWRRTYVVTAVLSLYLNFFVFIVQSFLKVPALHALAPTQSEFPFAITQLLALIVFGLLTVGAAMKFRGEPDLAA